MRRRSTFLPLLILVLAICPRLPAADFSLIEALIGRRAYVRANPSESAIVLTTLDAAGRAAGVCVATQADRLVELFRGGPRALSGLSAMDLDHPERVRRALSPAPSTRSDLAELAAGMRAAGYVVEAAAHGLVFDWLGGHYRCTEDGGCHCARIPPLTPAPHWDLIDSILFAESYRRRFPHEKSVLVIDPLARLGERLVAAAAFTRGGRLGLHSLAFGEHLLADSHAADISNPPILFRLVQAAARRAARSTPPTVAVAAELAGDTALLQLARLRELLAAAGVPGEISDQIRDAHGRPDPAAARLVFEWEGRQFGYTPATGAYFKGPAPAPVRTSLVDGILFATAYRRQHPAEQALVIAHPISDLTAVRRMVADTVYTLDGAVRCHSLLAGDFPLPETKVADLGAPGRLTAVIRPLFAARFPVNRVSPDPEARRIPCGPPAQPGDEEAVCEALIKSGLRAALIPTAIRQDDGRIETRADSTVKFLWEGTTYLYHGNACYLSAAASPDVF